MNPETASLPHRNDRGASLVEMLIAAFAFSLMLALFTPTIKLSIQGSTNFEAKNSIKSAAQMAINKIGNNLLECRRLFQAADTDYTDKLPLWASRLAGSKLATKRPLDSLVGVNPLWVGNSLFFASLAPPFTINLPGPPIKNYRIDIYRFNFYYLALDKGMPIQGSPIRNLWEWHSVEYADYQQLSDIGAASAANLASIITALRSRGVNNAWDLPAGAVTAFYVLNPNGTMSAASNTYSIETKSSNKMIEILTGISLGNYRYGIAPNSPDATQTSIQNRVPRYAAASGEFPSGFEVLMIGPSSMRQVLVRMMVVAEGMFPEPVFNDQTYVATCMDNY